MVIMPMELWNGIGLAYTTLSTLKIGASDCHALESS